MAAIITSRIIYLQVKGLLCICHMLKCPMGNHIEYDIEFKWKEQEELTQCIFLISIIGTYITSML